MKKKRLTLGLALVAAICVVCAFAAACTPTAPLVLKESDTFIVIKPNGVAENTTLADYMSTLKADGELDFTISDGMITSVNGIANAADVPAYWMLYTSDKENAADSYGTVEYNGNLYGSSVLGADSLKVKNGEIYIWVYQTF